MRYRARGWESSSTMSPRHTDHDRSWTNGRVDGQRRIDGRMEWKQGRADGPTETDDDTTARRSESSSRAWGGGGRRVGVSPLAAGLARALPRRKELGLLRVTAPCHRQDERARLGARGPRRARHLGPLAPPAAFAFAFAVPRLVALARRAVRPIPRSALSVRAGNRGSSEHSAAVPSRSVKPSLDVCALVVVRATAVAAARRRRSSVADRQLALGARRREQVAAPDQGASERRRKRVARTSRGRGVAGPSPLRHHARDGSRESMYYAWPIVTHPMSTHSAPDHANSQYLP